MSAVRRKGRLLALLGAFGLVVSAIVGTVVDQKPARPVEMRAGYRVLEGDFHAHTRFSDGFLSPPDLVDQAARRGLDVLCVSEHNQTFPAKIARAYSQLVGGPTIVVGEEVTTRDYHLLAIGIDKAIDARAPLAEVIADAHAQGGVIGPAHPTHRFSKTLGPYVDQFDLTELMHPIAYQANQSSGIGSWTEMREFYQHAADAGHPLAPLGDSDFHFGSVLGVTRTFLFVHQDTAADVVDAIRQRHTVTFDLDGNGYGDPELVQSLIDQPIPERATDYGYAGTGWPDRIFRTLGFLSLLLLWAFFPTPRVRRG